MKEKLKSKTLEVILGIVAVLFWFGGIAGIYGLLADSFGLDSYFSAFIALASGIGLAGYIFEIDDGKKRYEKLYDEYFEKYWKTESENRGLSKKCSDLEEAMDEHLEERDTLRERVDELVDDYNQLVHEYNALLESKKDLEDENEDLRKCLDLYQGHNSDEFDGVEEESDEEEPLDFEENNIVDPVTLRREDIVRKVEELIEEYKDNPTAVQMLRAAIEDPKRDLQVTMDMIEDFC